MNLTRTCTSGIRARFAKLPSCLAFSPCVHHLLLRTLAMIKPDAYKHLGKIVNAIQRSGFMIK